MAVRCAALGVGQVAGRGQMVKGEECVSRCESDELPEAELMGCREAQGICFNQVRWEV